MMSEIHQPVGHCVAVQDESEIDNQTWNASRVIANFLELLCDDFEKSSSNDAQINRMAIVAKQIGVQDIPLLKASDLETLYQRCIAKAIQVYSKYSNSPFARNIPEQRGVSQIYNTVLGVHPHAIDRVKEAVGRLNSCHPATVGIVSYIQKRIDEKWKNAEGFFDYSDLQRSISRLEEIVDREDIKQELRSISNTLVRKKILKVVRNLGRNQLSMSAIDDPIMSPIEIVSTSTIDGNEVLIKQYSYSDLSSSLAIGFQKMLVGPFVPDFMIPYLRPTKRSFRFPSGGGAPRYYHLAFEIDGSVHHRKSRKDDQLRRCLAEMSVFIHTIENEDAVAGDKVSRQLMELLRKGDVAVEKRDASLRSLLKIKVRTIACWLSFSEIDAYMKETHNIEYDCFKIFDYLIKSKLPPKPLRGLKRKLDRILIPQDESIRRLVSKGYWKKMLVSNPIPSRASRVYKKSNKPVVIRRRPVNEGANESHELRNDESVHMFSP